jgi:hypothetical protein
MPNLPNIVSSSDEMRSGTENTLKEQHHRMMQSTVSPLSYNLPTKISPAIPSNSADSSQRSNSSGDSYSAGDNIIRSEGQKSLCGANLKIRAGILPSVDMVDANSAGLATIPQASILN